MRTYLFREVASLTETLKVYSSQGSAALHVGLPSTWDDGLATKYGPPVKVNGPLLSVNVLPLLGVIAIIELGEANAARAALNVAGAKLAAEASANEQNTITSEILSRLEVKVEKPERTVLRRRNMAASCGWNFRRHRKN
ncbi:MAG: hypothetical protein H0U60_17875 [Blastocatellia bacterium]|nr:hypothetical protein [Blastocatellia bacterium]